MQIDATVIGMAFRVESHQVSSSWKLDTPRGGLDEYQAAAADERREDRGRVSIEFAVRG